MAGPYCCSLLALALLLSSALAGPLPANDAKTCAELCANCNGVASFVDDRCECNISENTSEGAECITRMKRDAQSRGLDLLSCDMSSDQRSTRCTLGAKHNDFGAKDIDQVAKYFMSDGPITGSIFRAPAYTLVGKSADCVGGPQIITQPAETMPQQPMQHVLLAAPLLAQPQEPPAYEPPTLGQAKPKADDCGPTVGQSAPGTLGAAPTGALTPLNVLSVPSLAPGLLQLLGHTFRQPMLGIPQAIQTVSQTPGIRELVAAPGTLLNALVHQLTGNDAPQIPVKAVGLEAPEVSRNEVVSSTNDCVEPDDNVGSPASKEPDTQMYSFPAMSYMNPTQIVGLLNPAMGVPASQISLLNPVVGAPAPSPVSFSNPTVGAAAPSPISYLSPLSMLQGSYMPATYIVGTPLGMPYLSNFNNGGPSTGGMNMLVNMEDSPTSALEQNVGAPNIFMPKKAEKPILKQQKKICKKSSKDDASKKVTRDVKSGNESNAEEMKQLHEEMRLAAENELKRGEQISTEIPKIERTTTQKPLDGKLMGRKIKIEKFLQEKTKTEKPKVEYISKVKPLKEIIKKPRNDKKIFE